MASTSTTAPLRIRLLTFDAYNTLFKPKGSLSAQYASNLTLPSSAIALSVANEIPIACVH